MNEEIKQALNRAINQLPHPDLENLAAQPVSKMMMHDEITSQEKFNKIKKKQQVYCYALSFACMFLLCTAGAYWYTMNRVTSAIIDLDINPGFEISINKNGKALEVSGINQEARDILKEEEYEGRNITEIVESLILAAEEESYLTEDGNIVLLSVGSRNKQEAEKLGRVLSEHIRAAVDRQETPTSVIRQIIETDNEEIRQQAAEYGMTTGKLLLVKELAEELPEYSEENMRMLDLEQIFDLAWKENAELLQTRTVDYTIWGTWIKQSEIGIQEEKEKDPIILPEEAKEKMNETNLPDDGKIQTDIKENDQKEDIPVYNIPDSLNGESELDEDISENREGLENDDLEDQEKNETEEILIKDKPEEDDSDDETKLEDGIFEEDETKRSNLNENDLEEEGLEENNAGEDESDDENELEEENREVDDYEEEDQNEED